MSSHLSPPSAIFWTSPNSTSVNLSWASVHGADYYEICGGGTEMIRRVDGLSVLVRGLPRSSDDVVKLRACSNSGEKSSWEDVVVITSVGVPLAQIYNGVFPVRDVDSQSFRIRLPDKEGNNVECLFSLRWHPSDGGWWASLESPVNASVVRGRRLCLNGGVLDGIYGVLSGNIVMRATAEGSVEEPTRDSFASGTHEIRWEDGSGST